MLDVNIIHYDEHNTNDLVELRLALENEFEYHDNELFKKGFKGFKNAIKGF
jgi:hypothetical protein